MAGMAAPPRRRHKPILRRFWREWLRPAWRWIQPWPVLIVAALVPILGTIGWSKAHANSSFIEPFYRAMQLFGLGGSVPKPPVPVELDIARVIAPVVVGYAAIRGVIALFREQVQLSYVRMTMRDHLVVVGLGSTGFGLATAFHEEEHERVVAVELDRLNPGVAGCRERGISVLIGDATDAKMLRRARIGRARHLIVASGDDRVDLDIARAAETLLLKRQANPLSAFVSLDSHNLWQELTAEALARPEHSGIRREFFHIYERAARMLLQTHAAFEPDGSGDAHVLLVGVEGVGESLTIQLANAWQSSARAAAGTLHVTVVGPRAEEECGALLDRYPELERACRLEARNIALDSAEYRNGELAGTDTSFDSAYVCLADEGQALPAALALGCRSDLCDVQVVMTVEDHNAGAASALRREGFRSVAAFGVRSAVLTPALIDEGTYDVLARVLHAEYVEGERANGNTPASRPAMVDWDELAPEFKHENRQSAMAIGAKLDRVGCVIVPAPVHDPSARPFTFSEDELDLLARLEHERWCESKRAQGLVYGPVRDAKHHPSLVGWDKLTPEDQERDRRVVRAIPDQLAKAGFGLRRRRSNRTPKRNEAAVMTASPR